MNKKLVVTAGIGIVVGIAIGYAIFTRNSTIKYTFIDWLTLTSTSRNALLWAVMGAGVGAGINYLRKA